MPKFNFSFVSLRRKQVALVDASGISILSKYIPDNDLSVIDIEHLNFFAALRMLAAGKNRFSITQLPTSRHSSHSLCLLLLTTT